jgi:hypothetical protein
MWNAECCDCDERGIRYDAGWRMVEGSSFHLGVRGCSRYPSRDRRAPESKVEVANISYSGLACGASFQ